jgi:hypothetical protein
LDMGATIYSAGVTMKCYLIRFARPLISQAFHASAKTLEVNVEMTAATPSAWATAPFTHHNTFVGYKNWAMVSYALDLLTHLT